MTKRITEPIKTQIEKAGRQIDDILSDYSARMFKRLRQVETQFEEIEKTTEVAQKSSDAAKKKVAEAQKVIEREFTTRNEAITRILSELYAIVQEGGEELNDVAGKLATAQLEIGEASKLADQMGALARGGRWDVTNVEMMAKAAELFSYEDENTIGILMDKVDLEKWQAALRTRSPKRWLEIEIAFEAARHSRD